MGVGGTPKKMLGTLAVERVIGPRWGWMLRLERENPGGKENRCWSFISLVNLALRKKKKGQRAQERSRSVTEGRQQGFM